LPVPNGLFIAHLLPLPKHDFKNQNIVTSRRGSFLFRTMSKTSCKNKLDIVCASEYKATFWNEMSIVNILNYV